LNTAGFQQRGNRFSMCQTEGAEHDKGVVLVDVERRIADSSRPARCLRRSSSAHCRRHGSRVVGPHTSV